MKPTAHQIGMLVMLLVRVLGAMAFAAVAASAAMVYHDINHHRTPIKPTPACKATGGTR